MDEEQTKMRVFVESNEALVRHMGGRTIAIAAFADGKPADLGSGTCVQIAGQFFVATAAHVIEGCSREQIRFVYSRVPSADIVTFARGGFRGGGKGDALDIAWLELTPEDAARTKKDFIQLDRIAVGECHLEKDLVLLSGFPAELINKAELEQNRLAVRAIGYYTQTRVPEGWPSGGDQSVHMFIDYPQQGNVAYGGKSVNVPHPRGVSGGGIWAARINNGGVWTADKAQLIGIEYSWHPGERWARGVQMQHWLAMVREDVTEVADAIDAALAAKRPSQ